MLSTRPMPTQLHIVITDIDPSTVYFGAQATADEAQANPLMTIYKLELSRNNFYGEANGHTCTDTKTGQIVTKFLEFGITFGFEPLDEFILRRDGNYNGYTFDVYCNLNVDNQDVPDSTNIGVAYTDSNGDDQEMNIPLKFPPRGFIEPIVELKSAKIQQQKDNYLIGSDIIDIEFTTDTPGDYSVTVVNGNVRLSTWFNLEDDNVHFTCSAGKDENFAYVYDNRILVRTATADIIKCRLYGSYPGEHFVNSGRTSVVLHLTGSNVKVARTLDINPLVGHFITRYVVLPGGDSGVAINLVDTAASKAPINVNSTIEFEFSPMIDVSHFVIAPGYREYPLFLYDPETPVVTMSVDKGKNSVIFNDISGPGGSGGIVALFFHTSNGVDWASDHARQGSLKVKVDGVAWHSGHNPGQHEDPLIWRPGVDLAQLENKFESTSDAATSYTLVQEFTLHDNYENYFTTPGRPHLLFSLHGNGNYKEEERSTQLKCQITSPTYSGYQDLQLTYISTHRVWESPLLNDIKDLETFRLKVRCERIVNKINVFGRDVTPIESLVIDYIDKIDDYRYGIIQSLKITPPEIIQPATQTGTYPPAVTVHARLTAKFVIPSNLLTSTLHTDLSAHFKQVITDKLTTSNVLTTYTPIDPMTQVTLENIQDPKQTIYYALHSGFADLWKYTSETLGHYLESFPPQYEPLNGLVPLTSVESSFSSWVNIHENTQIHDARGQPQVSVTQYYTTGITTLDQFNDVNNADLSLNKDIYTLAEENRVRANEIILAPLQTFTPQYEKRSPFVKCGYESGAWVGGEVGQSYGPVAPVTPQEAWATFKNVQIHHWQCPIGAVCAVNADCATGICEGGKCAHRIRRETLYRPFTDMATARQSKYFNSAQQTTTTMSVLVAAIFAIIVMF